MVKIGIGLGLGLGVWMGGDGHPVWVGFLSVDDEGNGDGVFWGRGGGHGLHCGCWV